MTHGLRKKPTDFGGNPDHVTAGLGLGRGVTVTVMWGHRHTPHVLLVVCLTVTILRHERS